MSYFTLAGVPIRVKTPSADLDYLRGVSVEPLIGAYGSNTTYLGRGGKTLDFQVEVRDYDDVETIRQLANNGEVVPLVSPAIGGYNVLWRITKFVQHDHSTPENPNHFKHKISLQQHSEFNVTQQNFTNWKVQKKSDNKNSSATNAAKLVMCATLKQTSALVKNSALDAKVAECVKEAQKALRTHGEYVISNGKSTIIDGYFGSITQDAVRKFQKNNLPVTGIIDNATKAKL